jgi:hypothetical protein
MGGFRKIPRDQRIKALIRVGKPILKLTKV